MIQLQYYNKGLSKAQIEQILKNYNLKYTTITNEINLKLNSLIKTVLNDISPFLENIEYLSKKSKQLKEFENAKNRIEALEHQLKEKIIIEKELQESIISLKQEISDLKEKEKEFEIYKLKNEEKINIPQQEINIKNRKKTLDINNHDLFINSSFDKTQSTKSKRTSRDVIKKISEEENSHKSAKKSIIKNVSKWNKNIKYMMNLKEITRNLNNNNTKNNENLDKFLSGSKPNIKNKKRMNRSCDRKIDKKTKEMILNNEVNNMRKFEINKNDDEDSDKEIIKYSNYNNKEKNYILDVEEIDEEIKNLEIDEQNILKLINKINSLTKTNNYEKE